MNPFEREAHLKDNHEDGILDLRESQDRPLDADEARSLHAYYHKITRRLDHTHEEGQY